MAITQPAVTEQRNGPSTKQNHVTNVTRVHADADGIIRLTESHGALKSVDVADVDLVLGFADGSYIIIPNGALDALEVDAPKVEFDGDKFNTSLTELFQQVGTVDAADAGNLRIISENIDTRLTELQPDEIDYTSLFMALNNHTSAPTAPAAPLPQAPTLPQAAQVQRGSINGRGNNSGEFMDAIVPPRVDQPSTYRLGNRVETGETLQNIGSPVVSGQLYVASQLKTGADFRSDLPNGARGATDPNNASHDPASPAAQATREVINATGNVNLNQQFAQNNTGLWEKNFFIGTNFDSVVSIEVKLTSGSLPVNVASSDPAYLTQFQLTHPSLTVTRVGDTWTISGANLSSIINQNGGIDINLVYRLTPDGETVTNTAPFTLQVVVNGLIGVVPVSLPKDFYFSYRDAETGNAGNFNDSFNGNPLFILPARGTGYDIHVDNNGREVIAGSGADIIRGGTGNDTLYGGVGNDTIYANAGNNWIEGGTGNDYLYSGSGQDTFIGGDGTDTVSYKEAISNPDANANNSQNPSTPTLGFNPNLDPSQFTPTGVVVNMLDNQFGNLTNTLGIIQTGYAAGDQFQSIENLEGSNFDDLLIGNANANHISGGAGNDTIIGIGGGNTLDGGTGSNTVSYVNATNKVVVNLSTGTGKIGSLAEDKLSNFTHIIGAQNAENDLTGNDQANYILGGNLNDTITGGGGADTIDGGTGNNTARYTTAVKVSLTNEVYSNSSGSTLTGALNGVHNYYRDDATGHAQGDHLINIQNLMVTSGDSLLIGNDGANRLTGGSGNDTLIGGKGNDTLGGGGGTNTVTYEYVKTGGVGVNVTLGNGSFNGSGIIASGDYYGIDQLNNIQNIVGTNYNDTIRGNSGNNILEGGAGNDVIYADKGHDIVRAGADSDTIYVSVDIGNSAATANNPFPNRFTSVDGGTGTGIDTLVVTGFDPGKLFSLVTFVPGVVSTGSAQVTNIDVINIKDNVTTTFAVDANSINSVVGGAVSTLKLVHDNGANGDILSFTLSGGEYVRKSNGDLVNSSTVTAEDTYTIYSGNGDALAHVQWTAVA